MLHCLHAFLFFPVVRKLHFTHPPVYFILFFFFPYYFEDIIGDSCWVKFV